MLIIGACAKVQFVFVHCSIGPFLDKKGIQITKYIHVLTIIQGCIVDSL